MGRRPRHGSRRAPSPPTRSACASRVRESPRADLVSALIALAEIVRPHGLRGEVKALLLTDGPGQLAELAECYLWDAASDARLPCRVEQCRVQGRAAILALEGIRSIAEAQALVGRLVAVPEETLAPLPR